MRFWDTSAIVPLIVDQPRAATARGWLAEDDEIVVWWGTTIECASAIARLHREGTLDVESERRALGLLDGVRAALFEIRPTQTVRDQALRILRLHPLRAADALQLAAALEWIEVPQHGTFLTFDARLRDAALREGFHTP